MSQPRLRPDLIMMFREHDIIVINEDGSTENITKFPFGPEHNVIQ